MEVTVY